RQPGRAGARPAQRGPPEPARRADDRRRGPPCPGAERGGRGAHRPARRRGGRPAYLPADDRLPRPPGPALCDVCPHFEAAASRSTFSSADVTVRGASGLALPVVASYFPLPAEGPGPRKDAVILCELTARPAAGTAAPSSPEVVDPE